MKNKRRFTITVGSVLMVCMLVTGYVAVAAEYGSADDPLITQSYLEQVLTPSIQTSAENTVKTETARYQSAMEKKITEMSQALDDKVAALAAKLAGSDAFAKKVAEAGGVTQGDVWTTVQVAQDKTLRLNVNAEVILRSGNAVCVESAGTGLIDLSGGGMLRADAALEKDQRYIATTQGAGLHAVGEVTALVYGEYTLS